MVNATLSLSVLQLVKSSSPKSARDTWVFTKNYFFDKTASVSFSFKAELCSIKKGSMPTSEYMQKVKSIGGALLAIREGESDHNLVMTVLLGLPKDHRGFVSALNAHKTKPTFD